MLSGSLARKAAKASPNLSRSGGSVWLRNGGVGAAKAVGGRYSTDGQLSGDHGRARQPGTRFERDDFGVRGLIRPVHAVEHALHDVAESLRAVKGDDPIQLHWRCHKWSGFLPRV